jgi:rhodanese-related sulfurtransferase
MRQSIAVLALLLAPVLAHAQGAPLPEGVKAVDADGLQAMLDGGSEVLVVNTLSPLEFTQTKIAGSVNLSYGHLRDGQDKLPADKGTTLVFYCLGPK